MALRNYVMQREVIKQEDAVFNLDDFYRILQKWFSLYHYDWIEEEYKDILTENGKDYYLRWFGDKNVAYYVKFCINVELRFKDVQQIEVKGKKMNKGNVELTFWAYVLKDYEKGWESGSFLMFMREITDRFFKGQVMKQYEEQLKQDVHNLMDNAKAFLNMHRMGKMFK